MLVSVVGHLGSFIAEKKRKTKCRESRKQRAAKNGIANAKESNSDRNAIDPSREKASIPVLLCVKITKSSKTWKRNSDANRRRRPTLSDFLVQIQSWLPSCHGFLS